MIGAVFALHGPVTRSEPLTLEAYVQAVMRAHPGARQAAALERTAAAEHKAARAWPDPVVAFARATARPVGGARGSETEWSVSQTVPWWGALSANARAAGHQSDALQAEATAARWALEIEARSAFARLMYARAAARMAREAEADAIALRDLTAQRAELGESRELDRIKTQVEWLRQQRSARALERESGALEAGLRKLAVEPLASPLVLAGQLTDLLVPVDPNGLRARLAGSNPVLRTTRAQAERAQALASAARRARIPDLDVTWFRSRELDKTGHGLGLALSLPLWSAGRGPIARAQAGAAQAAAQAARATLDVALAFERALAEFEVASEQAAILAQQILPAAQRSLDLARFSHREGETSLLDLLDAQRTFRDAQREVAAAWLAAVLAQGEIQRLVGPDLRPGGAQ
jgi:cobalt-zinc-cadmium efflux system outer membrane protein